MQESAYTTEQVLAAAALMRARGEEPTRLGLWKQLGQRGNPMTAWKKFEAEKEKGLPAIPAGIGADPEMPAPIEKALKVQSNALITLMEAVKAEAMRPLELEIRSLKAALQLEMQRAQDLEDLAEEMQVRIDELSEQVANLGPRKWIS